MTLAQGAGRRIAGGGMAVPAYARIYAMAQPLSGPGIVTGSYDSHGQYLHFRYEGNLNLGARSGGNQTRNITTYINPPLSVPTVIPVDFVPNKIAVEFDVQSSFTLPFEGELYLIGGTGEWKFSIDVHDTVDIDNYEPDLHTLRTLREAGAPFVVPDNHTYILGVNTTTNVLLPGGVTGQLSTVLPGTTVTPGTTLTPASTTWLVTGWMG